jgi:uncharacterized repeat protein (TIGR03803 family)
MTRNQLWPAVSKLLTAATVMLVVTLVLASAASASRYNVLYQFRMPKNGQGPSGNLIMDAAGNLYGTTQSGGADGFGTVFRLKPNPDGSWSESVLHSFTETDGASPLSGVISDDAGDLYGTTSGGGDPSCPAGCGVVFKLTRNAGGTWAESVLHAFTGVDGNDPEGGVIMDAAGNLYGTASQGGANPCSEYYTAGCGVVFQLKPHDGSWSETILHSFTGADGLRPHAGLIVDAAGNLYGTTDSGGPGGVQAGAGVVFKLMPSADGTWTESVLHAFTYGADGANPWAGLAFDAAGNLYGTTLDGGGSTACYPGCGTVFRLTLNPDATWTENVIHSFTGGADGAGGIHPVAGLLVDAVGNLYGTTVSGGIYGAGVVFKLAPTSSGWTESVLHTFTGYGFSPSAGVIMDAAGNLYGTVSSGSVNYGFVFEILKKCPDSAGQ